MNYFSAELRVFFFSAAEHTILDLKNKSADIIILINKHLNYNLISNTFFL